MKPLLGNGLLISNNITMNIPLLIRIMEFSREDAKTDMDLHRVAEKAMAKKGKVLTMKDYAGLVKK
jgi:hypothetical protein